MLSRVAESVYWMSRYIERAENVARVVGVDLKLEIDLSGIAEAQWDPMVKVSGDNTRFAALYDSPTRGNVIEFLTFDLRNPNAVVSCVARARENARTVREIISSEMWEEINTFYLHLTAPAARDHALSEALDFFQEIRRTSHLIEGTKNETMEHGEAWHFSRLGRFLERADQTSRILDVKYFLLLPSAADVGKPVDDLQWSAVLRSTSGFEAYRRTFGRVTSDSVVAFLLFDRDFPRSVQHCVGQAQASLHTVTGTPLRRFENRAEQVLGRLVSELDYTDVDEVVAGGLHEFIDQLQDRFNRVGDAITTTFFRHGSSSGREPEEHARVTYCLGMNLGEGILGVADTQITSGHEITTLRKVTVYSPPNGTLFIMTSGLRSLRDKTLTYFDDALRERQEPFDRLYQAVNLLADQVRRVAREDRETLHDSDLAFNIHTLVGGQMRGDDAPKLFLLYPEGNWVDTGRLTPYHIIGSTGYGKPILDRTLKYEDSLRHAFKAACLSFDSTRISAADVDFPIDVVLLRPGTFRIVEHRFGKDDLEPLSRWWDARIRQAVQEDPGEWLRQAFDALDQGMGPVAQVS